MKLTNRLRDEFVVKVINSLHNIDYISQTQELLNKEAFNALPEALKIKDIQHYLETKRIYLYEYSCLGRFNVRNSQYEVNDETREKIKNFHTLFAAQRDKKHEVEKQLNAIIHSCTTLKKAKEVLPEDLHKYLPVENDKPINEFALTTNNLMESLKELGLK